MLDPLDIQRHPGQLGVAHALEACRRRVANGNMHGQRMPKVRSMELELQAGRLADDAVEKPVDLPSAPEGVILT